MTAVSCDGPEKPRTFPLFPLTTGRFVRIRTGKRKAFLETEVVMASAVAEERDLIRRSQAGEREAFGLLVRGYMERAYRTTYALVGNHADAVELSQEAFARAYRALDGFDSEAPFYPWFHRILRNLAYDRLRRRRLEPRALDPSSTGALEPSRAGEKDPADVAEQRVKNKYLNKLNPNREHLQKI